MTGYLLHLHAHAAGQEVVHEALFLLTKLGDHRMLEFDSGRNGVKLRNQRILFVHLWQAD